MTQIRAELSKKNEWYISKHAFYAAYHYALQYEELKAERNALLSLNAVANDGMPHGTQIGNPTEQRAFRILAIDRQIDMIESCVREADPELYQWILYAVTHEGVTYEFLDQRMTIPCGRNKYFNRRRRFYYYLSDKIGTQGTTNIVE